jgi:phosphatidylserine/phosphatidylglycerophosphate/cardiolipin synthase-like enzyme
MVQFLNTAAAYSEIENIISQADKKLVLVSPYIRMSQILFEKLFHASENRGINMTIVCRGKDLKPEEYSNLRKISRLEILDLPNLHAKCFYNEKSMVITSLNLYDYARTNNREMGILITREKDALAFRDAVNEAEFMAQIAFRIEAEKAAAAVNTKRVTVNDVPFFDVQAGLRRSFPTFAKLLTHR